MLKLFTIATLLLVMPTCCFTDTFEIDASYRVCFTPAEDCTHLIVAVINQAKKEIRLQAYSFTSTPIAKALLQAEKRGVDIKVILDKSQYREHGFSSAKLLMDYHIPVWIDDEPAIAHNKVIIIDQKIVVTGSFNFTRAAQEKNAENVLIINDSQLAAKYLANWQSRLSQSIQPTDDSSPFHH